MHKDKVLVMCDRLIRVGTGGLLFFIPISKAFIEIFIVLVFIGFIGKKIIKPDWSWAKNGENMLLALFFIFMALSLINSGQHMAISLKALIFKWGEYAGLFLILQDTIRNKRDVYIFTGIFLCSACLVSLSGITQYLWGVEFLRGRETFIMIGKYKRGIEAITSCFSHPNALAVYLTIPLMICISCLTTFRMSNKRFYASIMFLTILLGYCFFYTYSRGAWLSLAGALFFMIIISKKKAALILVFIFFGILLLLPQSRVLIFSMVESGGDADRFKYWQAAFAMVKEHPFLGQGLGTFMQNFGKHQPDLQISYAHNCYLQVLAETGLFGLIAFLAFVSCTLYKSVRAYLCAKDVLHLGAICGVIGYLIHSFFENNLYSLPLAVLFWVWLGLVSSLSLQKENVSLE